MTATKPDNDNSWAVLDLANKITFPHQLAALLVFRYLAKLTDGSSKRCFPGYALISAMCGGIANSTISEALDYLYGTGMLRLVKKGHGNQHGEYNASNRYEFNTKAMRWVLKHQGIYSADDRLHGKALTARVKLLSSLTLPSMPAELPVPSAELPEQSAELSERRVSHSLNHLSANPTPSINQLTAEPAPVESPARDNPPSGAGTQQLGGTPQYRPPLSSPTLPSSFRADRVEHYITFDDGWTSDKPQKFPTNLLVRDEAP